MQSGMAPLPLCRISKTPLPPGLLLRSLILTEQDYR